MNSNIGINPVNKDLLVHQVYSDLKKMILSGELQPGEKLYQERIARRLGVSRTPLVKAFHILEHEMLIRSIPGRGMYVAVTSIHDLIDAFECRQGIETTGVRIIANKITPDEVEELKSFFKPFLNSKNINYDLYLKADSDFHHRLIQLSHNNYLVRMSKIVNIFERSYEHGLIREPSETLPEHLKIISALETRDPGLAEEFMRNHIRKSIEKIKVNIIS